MMDPVEYPGLPRLRDYVSLRAAVRIAAWALVLVLVVIGLQQTYTPREVKAQTVGPGSGLASIPVTAITNTTKPVRNSHSTFLVLAKCANSNASLAFLQFFNSATGSGITVGTTPNNGFLPLPASSVGTIELPLQGLYFTVGLQVAATTTATGGTAPGTPIDCSFGIN